MPRRGLRLFLFNHSIFYHGFCRLLRAYQEYPMKSLALCAALLAMLVTIVPVQAFAHAVAGDRLFPATMLTEDPAVSDELTLPSISYIKNEDEPAAEELEIGAEYSKTITEDFGLSIGGEWTQISPLGSDATSGLQNLELGAKYHVFTNAPHEFVFSLGLEAELGGTGSSNVGAGNSSTVTPTLYFGKGFGDLPESVALLRPFAVTGTAGYAIPIDDNGFQSVEWGFAIEYSLPYLHAHVRDIGLPNFLNHITPLVEMAFETPMEAGSDEHITGTINPGFLWDGGKGYQLGIEAMFPINHASGSSPGFMANLHFYLDDLLPNSLGKPLFASR
jgi:hypothetical protein